MSRLRTQTGLPASLLPTKRKLEAHNNNFIVPAGVFLLHGWMKGRGGDGADAFNIGVSLLHAGSGAGEGGAITFTMAVTPGQIIPYQNGQSLGELSWFGSPNLYFAEPGGNASASTTGTFPGLGGSGGGTGDDISVFHGADGHRPTAIGTHQAGGNGGGPGGRGGDVNITGLVHGSPGRGPGGGGGGGGLILIGGLLNLTTNGEGGAGAPGWIELRY